MGGVARLVFHVKIAKKSSREMFHVKIHFAEKAQRVLTSTEIVRSPADMGVSADEATAPRTFISSGRGGGG
jgi:hypothetical protein